MRWRERLLAGLVATPFVVGAVVGSSAAGPTGGHDVCAFTDPDITESSGLVVVDGRFVTMNDSGDSARVFTLDPRTCATVGVTRWQADAIDDESLAPAGGHAVWVGDTGENISTRPSVTVARVPVGPGDRDVTAPVFKLAYPDGPHDAETLLRDPRTGRLYLVSKEFIGHVYAAPAHLHAGVNRLTEGGAVLGLATDGAFFPDGRHIVLRNYGQAAIYTWPDLDRVATVDLPHQQQGEGIGVAPDGRIYLTSEGPHAPVLELTLPRSVRQELAGGRPAASAGAESPTTQQAGDDGVPGGPEGWRLPLVGGVLVVLGAVVAGVLAWRRR